jgi:hypothetical protein
MSRQISPFSAGELHVQPMPKTLNSLYHIATLIRPKRLSEWLSGYDSGISSFLLNGFNNGFKLQFRGPPFSASYRNHLSARQNPRKLSYITTIL